MQGSRPTQLVRGAKGRGGTHEAPQQPQPDPRACRRVRGLGEAEGTDSRGPAPTVPDQPRAARQEGALGSALAPPGEGARRLFGGLMGEG